MICSRIVDEMHLVNKEYKYIVDTNILLYLYGDTALVTETKKTKEMSNKFNIALNNKCTVYVPAMVIGEFINRYHKLEFNRMKKKDKNRYRDYKNDYRDKEIYIKNNKYILKTVKESILSRCKLIDDGFTKANIEKIFSEDENQEFNDNLLMDIANRNELYLISGDRDTKKISFK